MTPTERLREMLDERGVTWVAWDDCTTAWGTRDDQHVATEDIMGTLQMTGVTPEGAIAATLGAGTCRLKRAQWDDGTCTWGCICTACDAHLEHETGIGYSYCPHCGSKVVG